MPTYDHVTTVSLTMWKS